MSKMIEGTYKDGIILLDHLPTGVTQTRVAVLFDEQPAAGPSNERRGIAYFGIFAPPDGNFTSDEELDRVKKAWNVDPDEWDR